jgi:hypothetical protein
MRGVTRIKMTNCQTISQNMFQNKIVIKENINNLLSLQETNIENDSFIANE